MLKSEKADLFHKSASRNFLILVERKGIEPSTFALRTLNCMLWKQHNC